MKPAGHVNYRNLLIVGEFVQSGWLLVCYEERSAAQILRFPPENDVVTLYRQNDTLS